MLSLFETLKISLLMIPGLKPYHRLNMYENWDLKFKKNTKTRVR
jgi:hypothetical protein